MADSWSIAGSYNLLPKMWNHQTSWPKAIVHLDADAFFASCEQALHPEYKNKPVITGAERGIASSLSYEAKRLGVKRGMTLSEIKKLIPDCLILPSDYETYSLFSKRMFKIMRRFTSQVEEYSIDEAFADITGLRRPLRMSYQEIAKAIKDTIKEELDLTVSVGLSVSKVLAKAAANLHKPNCFEIISTKDIDHKLKFFPVEDIWGIGPQTTDHLKKFGIRTAYDFKKQTERFIFTNFTKPHQEIWLELNGHSVYEVVPEDKSTYYSISKTRTFTPATSEKSYVFAQLVKNLENACIKARRHNLAAKELVILLRDNSFRHYGLKAKLNRSSNHPNEIIDLAESLFDKLFISNVRYRQTGVVLADLMPNDSIQTSLFEDPLRLSKLERVYQAVDNLSEKYGKHTVRLAASQLAHSKPLHQGGRSTQPLRQGLGLKGENKRQRLAIPMLANISKK